MPAYDPGRPLDTLWQKVRDFHVAFGQPAPNTPTMQSKDLVERRQAWIAEENTELGDATTLVDQADAYLDLLYFAIGGLVELGVRPDGLFNIVHGANMAKLHDGVAVKSPAGKVVKPAGWVAPEPAMIAEIERQVAAR